jgi:hypothetical protein
MINKTIKTIFLLIIFVIILLVTGNKIVWTNRDETEGGSYAFATSCHYLGLWLKKISPSLRFVFFEKCMPI